MLRRGFHTLVKNASFPSLTDVGSHKFLFGAQAHGHILSSLGFPFQASPHGLKSCLLERGFHTLIKNASFLSPIDVKSHKFVFGAQAHY